MSEPGDTSLNAQMRRNLSSDLRFAWGCQFALPFMAMMSFLPLGLAALFTDSLAVSFAVLTVFNLLLASGAFVFRRRVDGETLAGSVAGWLIVIAPFFAAVYALMATSHGFSI